jgi:hypothetical protein
MTQMSLLALVPSPARRLLAGALPHP